MDTLFMHNFNVHMIIGVYDWERRTPQTVRLDLEIGLPHSLAGHTDCIVDAINYAEVARDIRQLAAQGSFHLVETLAEQIANLVRLKFLAPWVKVSVTKLGAVRGIGELGITIERGTRAQPLG